VTRRRAPRLLEVGASDEEGQTTRALLGWCEWVGLPDLGLARLKAKLDTGARSCALHVTAVREGPPGFALVELPAPSGKTRAVRCRVVDHARVRDSGGHVERRPVIRTTLVLGELRRQVRVTLTDRGDMRFPMLIGRTALGGVLIDPASRFRLGRRARSRALDDDEV